MVCDDWPDQVAPPLAVVRIVCDWPTAKHTETVGQESPYNRSDVPEVWLDQVAPPLVVVRTVPNSPAAKQIEIVGQEIANSELVAPEI